MNPRRRSLNVVLSCSTSQSPQRPVTGHPAGRRPNPTDRSSSWIVGVRVAAAIAVHGVPRSYIDKFQRKALAVCAIRLSLKSKKCERVSTISKKRTAKGVFRLGDQQWTNSSSNMSNGWFAWATTELRMPIEVGTCAALSVCLVMHPPTHRSKNRARRKTCKGKLWRECIDEVCAEQVIDQIAS